MSRIAAKQVRIELNSLPVLVNKLAMNVRKLVEGLEEFGVWKLVHTPIHPVHDVGHRL